MRTFRPLVVSILAIALLSPAFSTAQGNNIIFSQLVPLNSQAGVADVGPIDSPSIRPTGLSLKLILTISATVEPKTYSMELECPFCEIAALSADMTIVGEKHISSDTWNFKDGPYVKEYIVELKATNTDMTLTVYLDSVRFSGITKDGILANLEVLVYDMANSTAQTVTQSTAAVQTTKQLIPGFTAAPESIILGLAIGLTVLAVFGIVVGVKRNRAHSSAPVPKLM